MQERGLGALEQTLGEEVPNQSNAIFIYQNGLNTLEANWQKYDSIDVVSYEEYNQFINEVLYQHLKIKCLV